MILDQVLERIESIHKSGYIYRDVKPEVKVETQNRILCLVQKKMKT